MTAWLLLISMMNSALTCQAVRGERILGEDLARAVPAFSGVPRDAIIGYSPAPGTRRVLNASELARFGAKFNIRVPDDSQACFEWKLQSLTPETVEGAMRESLDDPKARVDVLAVNHASAPEGKLVFPLEGLSSSSTVDPSTPLVWRGYVTYARGRNFAVWARVRVSTTTTRVVATAPLITGKAIEAHQVRLETYDDFPLQHGIARTLEEVVGRLPRHSIRPGAPVFRTDLSEAFPVERGDLVRVTVISGAAQIALQAKAEMPGRLGDVIQFKNLASGKTFRARVEAKGAATLITGSGALSARVQ